MTGLIPLLMIWLWSRGGGVLSPPRSSHTPAAPAWPTAASPPPMPPALPAFASQPPPAPVHATADTGTPLSDLHKTPPKIARPDKNSPAARSVRAPRVSMPARTAAVAQRSATVSDIQAILNKRGAKLPRDGLYGPRTASAWSSLAQSKGLPGSIARVGPKVARVAMQTYDALSVPAIP